MSGSAFLYRHLAIPIVDLARRTESLRAFRELDASQWWSPERLATLQFERLKLLLIHAQTHVPYYRELFGTCGFDAQRCNTLADIAVIPLLTKDVIRRAGDRLLADNAAQFQPRPHRSAGTTGEPLVIQMDRARHSVAWGDMYRWWSAGGWSVGEKQYVVAGAALRPRRVSGAKAKLYSRLNHFEDYTAFDLTDSAMNRLLTKLAAERGAAFLRGYASSIHTLARHAEARDWQGSVRAVFTTAETLFPDQRKQIESALHTRVFDQWGCRDGGISAFECEQHQGLHLAVENAVVEVCDESGPVPAGTSGDVIATDLFSYAMPIIRYRVGDVASYATATLCACGRGLPLIASVLGRISGFLIGAGGKQIHGEFFSHVFWETPWVKEFQIVQDVPEEIVVNIVPVGPPPGGQLAEITRLMSDRVGPGVRIRVELVTEIPVGALGKRQFVICRIAQ
ncbi:phenylacetate--CoA ligase family protein [candidate division KSB1 bacterium]|nr:phenylacetate--CoA ligase family protein [candidate division KSB1 bacterium]